MHLILDGLGFLVKFICAPVLARHGDVVPCPCRSETQGSPPSVPGAQGTQGAERSARLGFPQKAGADWIEHGRALEATTIQS